MKKLWLIIFFSAFILAEIPAQSSIDVLLEKLKQNGILMKTIVYQPDDNSTPPIHSIIFSLADKSELIHESLEAFRTEQPKADMTMLETKENKICSETLIFISKEKEEKEIYMLEIHDESNAELTYIKSKLTQNEIQAETSPEVSKEEPQKMKFLIPENGYIHINGEKLTAEQARAKGYDVEIISAK